MPIMESSTTIGTNWRLAPGENGRLASGKIGRLKRMNPYVPIFRSTAARMTEPAVGASVCASGSHVWNGNIGTLIAKPRKNARNTHHCRPTGKLNRWNAVMSNVPAGDPVAFLYEK